MPLAARAADSVIYVLVDTKEHRAYIPEGTVLPQGLQIRAERADVPTQPIIGRPERFRDGAMERGVAPKQKRLTAPPLVFEYAPAERFEQARKQYASHHPAPNPRIRANEDRYCLDVYVSQTNSGIYGEYTDGLTTTFCGPYGTVVGNSYLWEFTVTGDYSYKDNRIDPYVAISDVNGNFSCYDPYQYNFDLGQCTASAVTQWTNTGCTNYVSSYGLLYVIEYTNDPYHDEYVGFTLETTLCTTFY